MRVLVMCMVLLSASTISVAQNSDSTKNTSYLGFQANQLLRQLLNFGGSNTSATSPYVLVYSVNSNKTGVGFNLGFGLAVNEFTDGDAVNKRTTDTNDFFVRFGYDKKYQMGKRWYASLGIDAVIERQKNKTINVTEFSPSQKTTVTSNTKASAWGVGPRGTFNYSVTDKIAIGTECTWYYKRVNNEQEVKSEFSGGQPQTDKLDSKGKRFSFASPAVIFLVLKW